MNLFSSCQLPGSSPLARGARDWNFDTREVTGLIPAGAGSTLAEQRYSEPILHYRYDLVEQPGS